MNDISNILKSSLFIAYRHAADDDHEISKMLWGCTCQASLNRYIDEILLDAERRHKLT